MGETNTTFSEDYINFIAEAAGIKINDDVAHFIAAHLTTTVKKLLKDSIKFMMHGKCQRLLSEHFQSALTANGLQSFHSISGKDNCRNFGLAKGVGRSLFYLEDRNVSFEIEQKLKVPLGVNLHSHWLAVKGIQPAVPENPPPLSSDKQFCTDPILAIDRNETHSDIKNRDIVGYPQTVKVKQLSKSHLSMEEEMYFTKITESCVGADENIRLHALQSLQTDPVLYKMLPRICSFIAEGVNINVVQNNLALLIYLIRMVKALLDNKTLSIEKYLHELVPSTITCCVSKTLCKRPDFDNHWVLRDFSAILISEMCKRFNNTINALQVRVTRRLSSGLYSNISLSSMYGCVAGLSELGREVIRTCVITNLKHISESIEPYLAENSADYSNSITAGHIRALTRKYCPQVLRELRTPPDNINEFVKDYGYLGHYMYKDVVQLRNNKTLISVAINQGTIADKEIRLSSIKFQSHQESLLNSQFNESNVPLSSCTFSYGQVKSKSDMSAPSQKPGISTIPVRTNIAKPSQLPVMKPSTMQTGSVPSTTTNRKSETAFRYGIPIKTMQTGILQASTKLRSSIPGNTTSQSTPESRTAQAGNGILQSTTESRIRQPGTGILQTTTKPSASILGSGVFSSASDSRRSQPGIGTLQSTLKPGTGIFQSTPKHRATLPGIGILQSTKKLMTSIPAVGVMESTPKPMTLIPDSGILQYQNPKPRDVVCGIPIPTRRTGVLERSPRPVAGLNIPVPRFKATAHSPRQPTPVLTTRIQAEATLERIIRYETENTTSTADCISKSSEGEAY